MFFLLLNIGGKELFPRGLNSLVYLLIFPSFLGFLRAKNNERRADKAERMAPVVNNGT